MTITAKFAGTCSKCHGSIAVGESIEWQRGMPARHTSCPSESPYRRPGPARRHYRPSVASYWAPSPRVASPAEQRAENWSRRWESRELAASGSGDGDI